MADAARRHCRMVGPILLGLMLEFPVWAWAAPPDRTPPTGTVTINGGAAYTQGSTVTLTLTAQDNPGGSGMTGGKAGMQIRNDNPLTWPKKRWEPYRTTKMWSLLAGDGGKTVYVKFRDKKGNAMRQPVNASIVVDTTPPTTPTVTDDGVWTSSTMLHATWTSADPESGIADYQYAIGTTAGETDIAPWTSVGTATSVTRNDLSLSAGATYYLSVKARNGAGAWSNVGWSDGIAVDATPPSTPIVTDNGAWTTDATRLHAWWSRGEDLESRLAEYQYAIGTTVGGTDTVGWTSAGLATEVTRTGLTLTNGATYYLSVKARNGAGLWSSIGTTDGIRVDGTPPTTPVVTDGGAFSRETSFRVTWTPSEDPESQIVEYQYAVGYAPDQLSSWTSVGLATEATITHGEHKLTYYVGVRAKNGAGVWSATGVSDGITIDTTAPSYPDVTDDGEWTSSVTTLHATWSSSDPESGIAEYQYAIGTSWDRNDVVPWTPVGTAAEITRTNLTLTDGVKYYINVKAQNGAGAWSAQGHSDGIQVDATPPTTPAVTDDGAFTTDATTLHAIWTPANDPESGVAEYQYAIGTTLGGAEVVGWTSIGTNTTVTKNALTLTSGVTYYVAVKARNRAGAWSAPAASDGIVVDATPPSTPAVMDDGETVTNRRQLHAAWAVSDPESGIAESQYAIGTSSGGTDVVPWTSAGQATEITHKRIWLTKGQRYFIAVKARNRAGLWSAIGVSDGILVVNTPPAFKPIGDKLIRVQPPGTMAHGKAAPPPPERTPQAHAKELPEGPLILLIKLKPSAAPHFPETVRAGQRLRTRAAPAHLKRIMDRSASPHAVRAFSLEELCARHQAQEAEPLFPKIKPSNLDRIFRMTLPSDHEALRAAVSEFAQHPQVEYCEPRLRMETFTTPNDPYLSSSGSWGQTYPDLWGLKRIQAEQAWDITAGSPDVVVAVIDTGIDPDHPDLFPNLWRNAREIPGNGRDDDGNGYVDDTWGWNFDSLFGNNHDPSDGHGHGTHVAGTIAAVGNNGQGIVGVAWQCRVMAVKGLNDFGFGFIDDLAQAIKYATDNGANVINMSWGGQGRSQVLEDVIRYAHDEKGVVLVAAAGNSNADAAGFTPANIEQVITVAAMDHTDHRAPWSNYGAKIDVAAPGGDGQDTDGSTRAGANILSCRANETDLYGDGSTLLGEYLRARGTSMAAPHVAGLCALIVARHPDFTLEQVRQVLKASADDIVDPLNDGTSYPGFDVYTGAGRINAARAVTMTEFPHAEITSPEAGASVSGLVEIRGSATSTTFRRYRLEAGRGLFPTEWSLIKEAATPVTQGALGSWDTANLPFGPYTFRLSMWTVALPNPYAIQLGVQLTPPMLPGWPVETHGWRLQDIRDLDGDGKPDLLLAGMASVDVRGLDGRRKPNTQWPRTLPSASGSTLAQVLVKDLDADGEPEIIVYSPHDYAAVFGVFGPDGRLHQGWPDAVTLDGPYKTEIRIGDVDGDGTLELAIGIVGWDWVSRLYLFRHDGTQMPGWPKVWPQGSIGFSSLALADLDGDGRKEIIVAGFAWDASPSRALPAPLAFYADGTPVPGWVRHTDGVLTGTTLIPVDLDGDGDEEVIAPAYGVYSYYGWDGDGNTLPGWPLPFSSLATLADVDGDGRMEIVARTDPGKFTMWHSDGRVGSGWPIQVPQPLGQAEIYVADLNQDNEPELILSPYGFQDYWGYGELPAFHAVDRMGRGLPGWPFVAYRPQNYSSFLPPLFADLDGDGQLELVMATWVRREGGPYQVWAVGMDGQVRPQWPITLGRGDQPLVLRTADPDQNGNTELLLQVTDWRTKNSLLAWDLPSGPIPGMERQPQVWGQPSSGLFYHDALTYPRWYVNGEKGYLAITLRASDADRDRLTYAITGKPAGASFNAKTAFFWWRPTASEAGTYRVTFSVSDGEATTSETITITVRAGNKKPMLTLPGTSYTVDEGQPLEFTLQATDPDGDKIQFLGTDLPRGATLDRTTGRFTWRPDFAQAGSYLLNVAASDGSLEDRKTIRITVRNVNRPPTITNPGSFTIKEGQILEFLLNAVDPDGDPLTFSATNLPAGATLVVNTGLFSWQPTFQQSGNYGPITVTVTDGTASASASFTITVQETPPWTVIHNKPIVDMTQVRTPTNVPTQVLTGTKAAYTAVLINGVEVVPRDRFTTWQTTMTLAEGDNALEIRARDVAGLVSDPVRTTIALDTVPPDLTVTTPTPGQIIPLPSS